MRIDILTLFPEIFQGPFSEGIFKRAVDARLVTVNFYNIRDFARDRHHVVDDYAYGGGFGMVLKPEPIFEGVARVREESGDDGSPVILMTPQGRLFNQTVALELSQQAHLVFICGRYEGVDERVRLHLATDEISIGDYVLGGGELAAAVVVDAVVRLLPGVVGSAVSVEEESHTMGLLEYPQYTRPEVYRDWAVPEILLSGNHAEIARWRREEAIRRTMERRPELLASADLSPEELQFMAGLKTNPFIE